MSGADDVVDHCTDSVVLEEAVATGGGLALELLHDKALQSLYVLMGRSGHLQQS